MVDAEENFLDCFFKKTAVFSVRNIKNRRTKNLSPHRKDLILKGEILPTFQAFNLKIVPI